MDNDLVNYLKQYLPWIDKFKKIQGNVESKVQINIDGVVEVEHGGLKMLLHQDVFKKINTIDE